MIRLSKSLYLARQQCDRRLWLEVHSPETATPLGEAERHILEQGRAVGREAHALFPDGVLVGAAGTNKDPVAATTDLMADESIPALFEAAFEHRGVRIRVDVLERLEGGGWGLREVKSSTSVKPDQHIPDLRIQKWVLEGCGLQVDSAELVYIDRDFVRGSPEIESQDFFKRAELIDELGGDLEGEVEAIREILARSEAPDREPGAFCKKPYVCRYWESCTAAKSASWYVEKMRARAERKIPMFEAVETGRPWFSDELESTLEAVQPPIWALDFETVVPAIPLFEGTSPFHPLVFQWSLHRLTADGELEHMEFLADGKTDPRPLAARSLLSVLADDDSPILVYSPYEKRCLNELANLCPDLASGLHAISDRLVDLLPIVRANFYHADLNGSFSIKNVAPTLAPHVTYADLDSISNGTAAMAAFARIAHGVSDASEEEEIRSALFAYCERDTFALMEVYRALRKACGYVP